MLTGIKVVDFSAGASGPFCARLLADWGARVIKVEKPGGDLTREWDSVVNGLSSGYVWLNRNKESLTLNLKDRRGKEIIYQMIRDADVVLENFTPGTVRDLAIDYETLRAINPRIIYCHISGYGQDGPFRDEKAFDLLMQGEAGLIMMNGTPEHMAKIPLSICDLTAGMYAALAISMALYRREVDPALEGEELGVTMFDSMLSWLGYFPHFYWHRGQLPERVGTRHHLLTPYGPYKSRDGKYASLAVLSNDYWRRFCGEVIERPDLLDSPKFENNEKRIANRDELEAIVAQEFLKRDRDDWLDRLRAVGIPCGRVNSLDEVLNHPQAQWSGIIKEIDTPRGRVKEIDNPIRSSRHQSRMDYIPGLGEHTERILAGLGLSAGEIEALRAQKVI